MDSFTNPRALAMKRGLDFKSPGISQDDASARPPREAAGDEETSEGGLVFVTSSHPEDFKSKKNMITVRKKAIDTSLEGDRVTQPRSRHSDNASERDKLLQFLRQSSPKVLPSVSKDLSSSNQPQLHETPPVGYQDRNENDGTLEHSRIQSGFSVSEGNPLSHDVRAYFSPFHTSYNSPRSKPLLLKHDRDIRMLSYSDDKSTQPLVREEDAANSEIAQYLLQGLQNNTSISSGSNDQYGIATKKRRRAPVAGSQRCHSCNRAETPEWRRGPDGARTLCNACGLRKFLLLNSEALPNLNQDYAKLMRTIRTIENKSTLDQCSQKGALEEASNIVRTNPFNAEILLHNADSQLGLEMAKEKEEVSTMTNFSIDDMAERRRLQNRIAQRNYRKKLKQRLEDLERRVQMNEPEPVGTPGEAVVAFNPDENTVDPEVLAYQSPDDLVVIKCVCDNANDCRFIIPCIVCGTWQHITCYYKLAQDVVEGHECIQCAPRDLNDGGNQSMRRLIEAGSNQDTTSTATLSHKRPKTTGAESSTNLNDDAQVLHLSAESKYQYIMDGKPVPGVHYPTSTTTSLTLAQSTDKAAEQVDRDRVDVAGQEIQAPPLPPEAVNSLGFAEDGGLENFDFDSFLVQEPFAYPDVSDDFGYTLPHHNHTGDESKLLETRSLQKQLKKAHRNPQEPVEASQLRGIQWRTNVSTTDTKETTKNNVYATKSKNTGYIAGHGYLSLAQAVHVAQNSEGGVDSQLAHFLERNLAEVWSKLNSQPTSYRLALDEFALLNYYRTRFNDNEIVRNATMRFWKYQDSGVYGQSERSNTYHRKNEDEPMGDLPEVKNEPIDDLPGTKDEPMGDLPEDELLNELPEANIHTNYNSALDKDLNIVQYLLPETWRWDVEFQTGCWTCTPLESHSPKHYPLTIGGAPVLLPVEYQWPPTSGVNPPPDPRRSAPIDCRSELALDVVRDLFLTFEGSIGFYVLISGLLQIIVREDFDTTWASSHLPHKYGSLKVCYIPQTLEATMLPSSTEIAKTKPSLNTHNSGLSSIFRQSRPSAASANPTLKLNDFIEARPKSNHRKEKYSGRIGLKVTKNGDPYLLMSTHIITEAILAKSHRNTLFGRDRDRFGKLDDDWNEHVEISAGNEKLGTIHQSFDLEAELYPNGFHHDITLIKPAAPSFVKDIASPISNLGWLNRTSWASLRQQTSAVKILGPTEEHRSIKSVKCSRPSEILVVGEGIFLNQTAAAGNSKALKDHDMSTWKDLVSRALLYRVYPDFDPPNGYSGIALYADGIRQDGTEGPGVVGFQSFVQRSGHVQNFSMEGPALERRLQLGRVAFYGAFEVPEELKQEYTIV
jgi:hypothetical protein